MDLFLDCEYNGNGGALISMALVPIDNSAPFYEVIDGIGEPIEEWVEKNVMPILNKAPISYAAFQSKLFAYCRKFPAVNIIADFPEDIKLFMQVQITDNHGNWSLIQPMSCVVDDDLSCKGSKIRHNALEDAKALRISYCEKQGIAP